MTSSTPGRDLGNPFAQEVGFTFEASDPGQSTSRLTLQERHLNPHRVIHGAVLYAMADTGMGAALYPSLAPEELCATIEIKMTYFKAVALGEVVCRTCVVNRGKRVAYLESSLFVGDTLIAKASGTYAVFKPSQRGD